jgi:hypothetical protein
MSETIADQVRAVDAMQLREVVAQDQNDPGFTIIDWSVETLSSGGVMNTEGLWRYLGTGLTSSGAAQNWQIVLKFIGNTREPDDLRSLWYEIRDGLMYESGLLGRLKGAVRAPRCYAVWKRADAWWIWMEHITESAPARWTMAEHAFAARALGQFHAEILSGPPVPDYPWMCRNHIRYWLQASDDWGNWNSPAVERYIDQAYRSQYEKLKQQRDRLQAALQRLPQTFSHFDTHRRNLCIRRFDNHQELVAFDWTGAGFNAVGGDLSNLVGNNLFLLEISPEELPELETIALREYQAGLRVGGADISSEQIRLAYLIWGSLWWGYAIPGLISVWTSDALRHLIPVIFRVSEEAMCRDWTFLGKYYLDYAASVYRELDRLGW